MSLSIKDLYLIGYNAACCIGWAKVLALALPMVMRTLATDPFSMGDCLSSVYGLEGLSEALSLVQMAALLEIVHAALGLVRSPVFVTTMQVGSRIAALYAITFSPESQVQFGAGLMILSWSLVEVPRYAFYVSAIVTGDATKKTPFPLFWLRYSLFAILYPTGITGELTVFLTASKDPSFLQLYGESYQSLMYYFIMSFPVIYAPGALPMILNMASNRKKAFKKRFAKPPPPPRGLVWPIDPKRGDRSSTPVAKSILSAALSVADQQAAQNVLKERNWRFGYVKHFIKLVQQQMQSPEKALQVAQAGLDQAYKSFQFVHSDGTTTSFQEAMSKPSPTQFHTGHIAGNSKSYGTIDQKQTLEVPYKDTILKGQALKDQVDQWVSYGTIEPSAGESIKLCVDQPHKYTDLSDKYFVLLGAGSAMGPFLVLMALGANVIAIDLDRPNIWKRILTIAQNSKGTITFPITKPQSECDTTNNNLDDISQVAGCNLFTQTPMIRDWLLDLYPDKQFTVGSYAYLDGALHVQVSLAMDSICRDLSEKRNASLAYLCTPTDLHVITKEAHDASLHEYKQYSSKLYCILMRLLSNGKFLRKNAMPPIQSSTDKNQQFYIVNGLSVAQGPNYALAKRMQHWRAILARSRHNCIVSSNIAPATSTVSVVHNRTFAWAYEGMPYFRPYEIFEPKTSNAVMSALLFADISNTQGAANPKTSLENPNELFKYNSFHGGTWRCAYAVDSIGEASVFIYFGKVAAPYLGVAVAVGAVVTAKYMGYV
mmetsp:Transcript_22308/g.31404  ORF Transcript_22308/g.31404 Transcript_22308/m.31404 type:complete len:769 (-) Transcript_22308:119-2425(-)|eukprot:CAMPEP_0184855708 /NCGR_PEP_ID=MMETSP0580-20130426/854_1 /TAXON_ID=1118495 /ORGANISM="Dactyliosolen fragilissimus" /LENGTH=768 /DNA_ID=CAMNT_0027350277 /DNA_START=100 /DNA_END=2406 /DNA_ORIENTATION=-